MILFLKLKKKYWKHEKYILLWAFSDLHGHLYTSVPNDRLLQIYNLKKDYSNYEEGNNDFEKMKKKVTEKYKLEMDFLRDDIESNKDKTGKIDYIMGNLAVKGFAEAIYCEENKRSEGIKVPDRIRISQKGLLLGEILFENYGKLKTKNIFKFLKRRFFIYKFGMGGLYSFILIAMSTVLLVCADLIVKMFFE